MPINLFLDTPTIFAGAQKRKAVYENVSDCVWNAYSIVGICAFRIRGMNFRELLDKKFTDRITLIFPGYSAQE
jgi:hypothetical protein